MTQLVSLADMKTYVGEVTATYDAFLTSSIEIVSDSIENYCGRKFLQASYTETFEAQDFTPIEKYKILSFHFPIISIASVKEIEITSAGTNETVITDYQLQTDQGLFQRTNECNGRIQWFSTYGNLSQVEITYDAGYATTPTPIQDVVFNLVAERYNKKVAGIEVAFGSDVQRVSIPGVMSIDFDYTLQANERRSSYGMILGNYLNILDDYRSERSVVGKIKENYVS